MASELLRGASVPVIARLYPVKPTNEFGGRYTLLKVVNTGDVLEIVDHETGKRTILQ